MNTIKNQVCEACGAPLDPLALFCEECGQPISKSAPVQPFSSPVLPQDAANPHEQVAIPPYTNAKRGKISPIFWAMIGLVTLCSCLLVGGGILFLITNTSSGMSTNPSTGAKTSIPQISDPVGCRGTGKDALVDLNCRKITIAIENAYLPYNYIEKDTGKHGGWDYDTWDEICTRLHCIPVYKKAAWEGMIQSVADGKFDVAADGIIIKKDRTEIVDFSIGYINVEQRLLVRKGETRFKSIEELAANKALRLGTQTGTTNYETATKYLPEDRIKAFEQFPLAVQALISGDIAAVIVDDIAGQGYLGENADKVELIGSSITFHQLGFIFPKGSPLVDSVNKALKAMMSDGMLTKFNVKYFGPTFKLTYDDIEQ